MSYASVTSHNAPADQPLPDPALLNTTKPTASGIADDTAKVGVVSPNFKQNPATTTSTYKPPRYDEEESDSSPHHRTKKDNKDNKAKAKKLAREAEKEAIHWSAVAKELVLRPPVAGGLVGVGKYFSLFSSGPFANLSLFSKPWPHRLYRLQVL
jgi:hypothetical protein